MHLKRSEGQRGHGIGRTQEVVATIVVELVHILQQVELVGSGIGGIAEQRGHVHAAEAFGQGVAHGVVPIKEVAGVVRTTAVLAIDASLDRGLPRAEMEAVGVVGLQREDMLVERGPLARDVVLVEPHILVGVLLVLVVKNVTATVGQAAVGVGIARAPIEHIGLQRMVAGNLGGVGGSAAVVILGRTLTLRLRAEALAGGVTTVAQLIEDVLPLILGVATCAKPRKVEHDAQTVVLVILVVGGEAQRVHTVVVGVVGAKEVVEHAAIGAILVGVVEGGEQSELASTQIPAVRIVGA